MIGATSHYWVIEHAQRGCFVKFDHDPSTGKYRPFFSWSLLRSDSKIERFWTQDKAKTALARIQKAGVRGAYLFEIGSSSK